MSVRNLDPGQSIESSDGRWYRILQDLGEGGNSVTHLVLQTGGEYKGNLFALKLFKEPSNEERRERFHQAQEFLERTDHPSILKYRDTGIYSIQSSSSTTDHPFLVSEYLPMTLRDVIQGPQVSIPEKLSYAIQLLSALIHLANRDPPVIHRDIKPENIFIKGGSVVLGDFGLMKRIDEDSGTDGEVWRESEESGMPYYYRSPDLVRYAQEKAGLTPKSDVFQLGLVLAELFTNRNPAVPPDGDLLSPVVLEEIGEIPGILEDSIRSLLERMLEMDPQDRPPAEEIMDMWDGAFGNASNRARDLNGRVL